MPHLATGRALALAAALAVSVAGAQTMYRWVDEKGVTHFSENPPPDDRKATKVQPKVVPPSTGRPAAAEDPAAWKAKEAEFRKRQIERGARETADQKERERREAGCARARERHARLEESGRIYDRNADGTKRYLEEAERAAEIARAREERDRWCR